MVDAILTNYHPPEISHEFLADDGRDDAEGVR